MNTRPTQRTAAPEHAGEPAGKIRNHFASSLWFPVAAAYAALILPWSVLAQQKLLGAPGALGSALGHAHEMLFGFALAVVAGYTLRPNQRRRSAWLLVAWAAARVSFLGWPMSWLSTLCNGVFVLGLAASVVPIYLYTDKWRNRSVAIIITALAVTVLAFHALLPWARVDGLFALLLGAVLLLSALMFFMGGRILAPAIAGHVRKQAPPLRHVVQPRLEGTTLVLLALALVCNLLPGRAAQTACALLLIACAALTVVRMARWRIWLCRGRADLLALLAGYGWLPAGWVLVGGALLAGAKPTAALHAITVGALGTLTFSVMLRTQLFRTRHDTNARPWAYAGAITLGLAALLRILPGPSWMVLTAAACWGLSYIGLCATLLGLARQRA